MSTIEAIAEILGQHIQSVRNQRCICGWRPDYEGANSRELFPEYRQHREHVAQVLVEAVLAKVLPLHPKACEQIGGSCELGENCPTVICGPCGESWPCPTVKALQ